jgi:spore coat polysaccharide biosynthesis predicted glycosyltransferase SpsG
MSRADLAIAAGGSVTWEFCCMGVPMVLMPVADNQEGIASSLDSLGAAVLLGMDRSYKKIGSVLTEVNIFKGMPLSALRLVDGRGVARVCERLERCL